MTEAQAEALDAVHFTAEKHCIALDCKSGDMQFWNNLAILHSREGFTDEKRSDNKEPQKRHLLRLWLRNNENPWRSPWAIIDQVNEVYRIEDANGRPAVKEKWPIHPIRNFDHVTTRKRASGHG